MDYEIDDARSRRFNQEFDGIHSIRLGLNYAFSI